MKMIERMQIRYTNPKKRASLLKKTGLALGDDCEVYPNVTFGSEPYLIKIGNHVGITANVKFITHDGGVWVIRKIKENPKIDKFGTIIIGDNVMIGTGSIIMPNAVIGENCIIGAGAVVTKEIPANSIAAGVPARVIGSIDEYYAKNLASFVETKQLNKDQKKDFLIEKYMGNK